MSNKRTIIKEAIESGEYTKAQLMEMAEVNSDGFASQLSYLRMSGVFPVADPDTGIFKLITEAEWEEAKAQRGKSTPKEPLTPAAEREKLEKKASRAASAQTNATKKAEADPDNKVLALKAQRASIDLEICEMELGQHQADYPNLDDASEDADGTDVEVDATEDDADADLM